MMKQHYICLHIYNNHIIILNYHYIWCYIVFIICYSQIYLKMQYYGFVTHISDKWLLLHQYLSKNIIFMCSSVYEYDSGLEIINIVSLHHVIKYLLAITHKHISKYNIMVLWRLLVINGYYFTNTFPKTIFSCAVLFMSGMQDWKSYLL